MNDHGTPEWIKEFRVIVENQASSEKFWVCYEDVIALLEAYHSLQVEVAQLKEKTQHDISDDGYNLKIWRRLAIDMKEMINHAMYLGHLGEGSTRGWAKKLVAECDSELARR